MHTRLALVLAATIAFAGAASADPPQPALVVQAKPVSRLLAEYKEMVRQAGGPAEGDRLVKAFEQELKDALGEEGFEGLDINRPLAAYSVLKEKEEDCGLVLVAPVTGEKEFLAFLKRLDIGAEAVEGKKGVYLLELPEELDPFPNDSHLQFADGWAYLTLNDGDPTDAKNLVPVANLFDPADPSLVSAKFIPGRVPEKLLTTVLEGVEESAANLKMFLGAVQDPGAKFYGTFLEHGPKLLRRYAEGAVKEVSEVGLKFTFDPMSGDTVTEITLVPKPGTALAKEVAAKGATTNRFAGLVPKDAAAGLLVKAPLFSPELRDIAAALFEYFGDELKETPDVPERLKPVVTDGLKALAGAAKGGTVDAGFALLGPDKAGKFTLVAGLSLADTANVEKALRLLAKDVDLGKDIELDVAKLGGLSVHKVPLLRLLPDEAREPLGKVFGEKSSGAVAFAKDAVFVAVGPDAVEAVKSAVEAKPGPAAAVDVTANAAKLQKLAAAIDPMAGTEFAKHVGTEDKPLAALRVVVEGGQKLTAKVTMNVRLLPKLVMAFEAKAEVAPPPR